jgi:hypothetical protein
MSRPKFSLTNQKLTSWFLMIVGWLVNIQAP